jgi:drug efflux transport system permease protein
MNRRLWAIARKETIQVLRDRRLLIFAFGMPVILLVLFGYAITLDISQIPTAIVDPSPSQESRRLTEAIASGGYFDVRWQLRDTNKIAELFDNDHAKIALIFPNDFKELGARGKLAPVQIIVDGADNNTAMIAMGYLQKIIIEQNRETIVTMTSKSGASEITENPLAAEIRVWYNPELKSRNFIIPGLMATILGMMSVMLTALCIAREQERGTFEQLVVTPIKKHELIIGKMIPYFVIGMIDAVLVLLIGYFLFDVPVKGSIVQVLLVCGLFLFAGLGQGLLISIVAGSQMVALQAGILSSLLPSILLSGFMFPVSSMPEPVQVITYFIPARHLLDVLRALMVKGVGLQYLGEQLIFLTAVALLFMGLAFRIFRKQVA